MAKIAKIQIRNKEHLDEWMYYHIGASWDGMADKYPEEYPCIMVMSNDRQSFGYIYKHDFKYL
jgi:hypothetical protein